MFHPKHHRHGDLIQDAVFFSATALNVRTSLMEILSIRHMYRYFDTVSIICGAAIAFARPDSAGSFVAANDATGCPWQGN